jgi:hypothetical protein
MIPRAALTQLGKQIARDLSEGQMSDALQHVGEALAASPDTVIELLDLMAKESRKKKPNDTLIDAYGFMLGQALEIMRYGIERNSDEAASAVEILRQRIMALAQDGKLEPGLLQMVLRQFVSAKLGLGEDLHAVMAEMMESDAVAAQPEQADIDRTLTQMARHCNGDIFMLQAQLAEHTATFPDTHRAGIVAALLGATEPSLREAAIGWLLDAGATTRRDTASLLQQAATAGHVSPTMLRRLIAMRNWLPEEDRPAVDAVIRTCRLKGVDCAPLAAAVVRDVAATGIDGSGAQSIFILVKDGRRQAAAALLLKQGIGVRDAWVNAGLTKAEADAFLFQVESQADCYDSNVDHVRLALGHALAVTRESGLLPPFALVDVVERAGLAAVNPDAVSTDSLVARLVADIPAEDNTPERIAEALAVSADLEDDFPFMDSWFEEDGAIDTLLAGKRLSNARRIALVMETVLPARRARWAELLAWTALTLRQAETTAEAWMDFALLSRELLGNRPLTEIPLMTAIAEMTVGTWQLRRD